MAVEASEWLSEESECPSTAERRLLLLCGSSTVQAYMKGWQQMLVSDFWCHKTGLKCFRFCDIDTSAQLLSRGLVTDGTTDVFGYLWQHWTVQPKTTSSCASFAPRMVLARRVKKVSEPVKLKLSEAKSWKTKVGSRAMGFSSFSVSSCVRIWWCSGNTKWMKSLCSTC